jgi:protease-4
MGEDAQEIGLVQELGGLYDAIDRAAELAELGDDFEVIKIPEVSNPMDEFTEMLNAEAKSHTSSRISALQVLAGASGLKGAESVIRALDNPRRTYSWLCWYRGSFGFQP